LRNQLNFFPLALAIFWHSFLSTLEKGFMKSEDLQPDLDRVKTPAGILVEGPLTNADTKRVNGNHADLDDDDDDDAEEDDLILGGEDEVAGDEEEFEVDLDEVDPTEADEDDLVIDPEDDEDDDDDDL
jgi:hypothetical protein